MDPYSHTPGHGGARQPGMTGQVKEEILTRWGELGVIVEDGRLTFQPALLRRRELLGVAQNWPFFDVQGRPETLALAPNSLAFTICQVPVIYHATRGDMKMTIVDAGDVSEPRLG